jgi:hypothetical protein
VFQEINLYEPIFRQEEKLFSAGTIGIGFGVVMGGLIVIALISWWHVAALDRQLQAIKAQDIAHERLVTGVNAMLDRGETREAIEARIKSLASELERRRQALEYLHTDFAGGPAGFAERMEALARQQIDGLWLKGAVFTAESGHLSLSGNATRAELVPMYLSRLASEPALAGAKLDLIEIHRPKGSEAGEIEFSVTSSKAAAGKSAAGKDEAVAVASNSAVKP